MSSDFNLTVYSIIFPIIFGIMAAFFLIIGLRGIITKRAFLLSNKWLLSMMFVIFVPNIFVGFFTPSSISFLIKLLNPAMFTVVLVMMCFALKGYAAFGVTDTTFRNALLHALQKLELSYEETLSTIRLTTVEADLQVSVQSWMGSGLLKVKQRRHHPLLAEIVTEMNEYLKISNIPAKLLTCVFYVIVGVFMAITGIVVSILLQSIN